MRLFIFFIFLMMSFSSIAQYVSVIGTATPGNWDTDSNMNETAPGSGIWTLTITLTANEIKFRKDGNWTINWGSNTFPSGTGILNGPNIPVNMSGNYEITFNENNLNYNFSHINSAPIAVDDNYFTAEDTPIIENPTLNDIDIDGNPLSITSVSNPINCSLSLSGNLVTITPDPNYVGSASFDYTVSDGSATDFGHVIINVQMAGKVGINKLAPVSTIDINGSFSGKLRLLNTSGPLTNTDYCVIYTGEQQSETINLPNAIDALGRIYLIVNHGIFMVNTSEYRTGFATVGSTIPTNTALMIISDGVEWRQIKL